MTFEEVPSDHIILLSSVDGIIRFSGRVKGWKKKISRGWIVHASGMRSQCFKDLLVEDASTSTHPRSSHCVACKTRAIKRNRDRNA